MTFFTELGKNYENTDDHKQPGQSEAERALLEVTQYLITNYTIDLQLQNSMLVEKIKTL